MKDDSRMYVGRGFSAPAPALKGRPTYSRSAKASAYAKASADKSAYAKASADKSAERMTIGDRL
jgi:hypothetical protein